jgi:hypothetical protein
MGDHVAQLAGRHGHPEGREHGARVLHRGLLVDTSRSATRRVNSARSKASAGA